MLTFAGVSPEIVEKAAAAALEQTIAKAKEEKSEKIKGKRDLAFNGGCPCVGCQAFRSSKLPDAQKEQIREELKSLTEQLTTVCKTKREAVAIYKEIGNAAIELSGRISVDPLSSFVGMLTAKVRDLMAGL